MRLNYFVFVVMVSFCGMNAQDKTAALKLVGEGVAFHDKGEYENAIKKYDEALTVDVDNLTALSEKAYSLSSLHQYEEAIALCKIALKKHPKEKGLQFIYVTYGNALDHLKKTDQAFAMYDKGIKKFPDYYQLPFNKGIAYSGLRKYDEAITCFQQAIAINPYHLGSLNGIARLEMIQGNKIPSILGFCSYFIQDPQSPRAAENLKNLIDVLDGNVKKTGEKAISISLDSKMFDKAVKKGKPEANDFSTTELTLTLAVALDYDEKYQNDTDVVKFIRKFETMCASLNESKIDNHGFYWETWVPYFLELHKNNFSETLGYLVFATTETEDVTNWFNTHEVQINQFYDWSKNYEWPKK